MRSVDRQVELVEAPFQAPGVTCYDLYFTDVRNARIYFQLLVPKDLKEKAPAVIQFHGYTGWTGDFSGKLGWTACGFVVAAMDCRGQGGYSEDTGGMKGTTFQGAYCQRTGRLPGKFTVPSYFSGYGRTCRYSDGV